VAQTAAPAAPPPPQAAAGSWPGLPGGQSSKGSKQAEAAQQQQPQAASSSEATSSSSSQQSGKKKKGQKQPLSELLAAGKTAPGNAWSQQQRLSNVVSAPTGNRAGLGQWGKQGGSKLAKSINAFNDAWGPKQ
jgi:hypothetical protein